MIVNLNCNCKVILNDKGRTVWRSVIEQLPEQLVASHPDIVKSLEKRVSSEGVFEAPLWEIMQIFGPFISQVETPFHINTLELNHNPNFGNYFKEN